MELQCWRQSSLAKPPSSDKAPVGQAATQRPHPSQSADILGSLCVPGMRRVRRKQERGAVGREEQSEDRRAAMDRQHDQTVEAELPQAGLEREAFFRQAEFTK